MLVQVVLGDAQEWDRADSEVGCGGEAQDLGDLQGWGLVGSLQDGQVCSHHRDGIRVLAQYSMSNWD